ncbi:MAG: metallophosphoesterase, partial [Thaumarchaeota archaeon]|nr:metallophosphoesterase [Nitrososphaerota archaeon]
MSISDSSKVVVASDQHLGYSNSQVDCFIAFLDSLSRRTDVGTLVVLGDWVDMWRRDVSGLFLEFHVTVQKLLELASRMKIVVVYGNHDYHELLLQGSSYPFEFQQNYSISSGGITYKFMHGWEFDYAQQPAVMELLCHNLSNQQGQDRSTFYNYLMGFKNELQELFDFHGGPDGYVNHLMQPPEQRLQPYLGDVEKLAFSSLSEGEKLVFGHTHRPFVSS